MERGMQPEDRLLFICTRQELGASHARELDHLCQTRPLDWNLAYEMADQHGVAPLVYFNLAQAVKRGLPVPPDVLARLKQCYIRNVFVKRRAEENIHEALGILAPEQIPSMLIKGEALGRLVYQQPWYTVSGDIDLVLKPRRDEMDALVSKRVLSALETINHRPHPFNVRIEYDFHAHHDVTMNGILEVDADRLWRDARALEIGGHEVLVMSPEDLLIAAAINSCRKRFFWLKSLCDIAETVSRSSGLDWELFAEKTHAYRCSGIVYTALLITQQTVGCTLPAGILESVTPKALRASTISSLVKRMCGRSPLSRLATASKRRLLGQPLGWPLLLTYAAYDWTQVGRKLARVHSVWRDTRSTNGNLPSDPDANDIVPRLDTQPLSFEPRARNDTPMPISVVDAVPEDDQRLPTVRPELSKRKGQEDPNDATRVLPNQHS